MFFTGAVRLGRINEEIIVNPSRKQLLSSDLNLVVVSAAQNLVVMLEGSANGILQPDFLKAIKTGKSYDPDTIEFYNETTATKRGSLFCLYEFHQF